MNPIFKRLVSISCCSLFLLLKNKNNYMNKKHNTPPLTKGCRGCAPVKHGLTVEQLNDLRDFLEELDLIPMCALPAEVWPLVYEHQQAILRDDVPFNPVVKPFFDNLSQRLKEKKKQRKELSGDLFIILD